VKHRNRGHPLSNADEQASGFTPEVTPARRYYAMPVDPGDADKYKVGVK